MKWPVVATIMLAVAVYLAPRGQGQQPPGQSQKQSQQQSSISSSGDHSDTKKKAADDQPPQWYKSPEWILVVVGIVTAFVIGWQSYETRRAANATAGTIGLVGEQLGLMRRQTAATETAANAAKDNIELLISKERARLRIQVLPLTLRPDDGNLTQVNGVTWKAVNHGPTKAFVSGSFGYAFVCDTADVSANIPIDYVNWIAAAVPLKVISGDSETASVFSMLNPSAFLGEPDINSFLQGNKVVHFRGHIKYQDVFGRECTTPFSMRWQYRFGVLFGSDPPLGDWIATGTPEANQET